MSEFKNKMITTKGMELLSKALGGEALEFTRIEMGAGEFVGDLGVVESLVQVKQNLPITKITRKGSQVTLSAVLKVEDITSEYDWTEIGVYARGEDGVDILYMYGHTQNSSFISKDSLNEKLINVTVLVSNATEVTAVIDDSMMFLTMEALKDHDSDVEAHIHLKNGIKGVKEELENISEIVSNINIDLEPINSHTTSTVEYARNNINQTIEACKNNVNENIYITRDNIISGINGTVHSARDEVKSHITNIINSKSNKYYKISTTVRHALLNRELAISADIGYDKNMMIGVFECKYDGFITIITSLKATGRGCALCLWGVPITGISSGSNTVVYEGMPNSSPFNQNYSQELSSLAKTSQGTIFSSNNQAIPCAILFESYATGYMICRTQIRVSKGQTIVFSTRVNGSGGSVATAYINKLDIGYDEVLE